MSNQLKAGGGAGCCKARYFTRHMIPELKSGIDYCRKIHNDNPLSVSCLSDRTACHKIPCLLRNRARSYKQLSQADMPRFHHPFPLAIGANVVLPEYIAHHIQVLRLAAGATITLFNGEGGEYTATLHAVEKKQASAEIKAFSAREAELPYCVTLAQALPEGTKMDWIVEKAVELGAAAIQPLAAQRCVVRLSAERAGKKMAHWQGIVIAASEQSGRNRLAQLRQPVDLHQWLRQEDPQRRILLSPRAQQSLSDWARHQPPHHISLLVGPEGGLTEREENDALAHGALAVSMGPRVLRTETAGLAALAMLNALWSGC